MQATRITLGFLEEEVACAAKILASATTVALYLNVADLLGDMNTDVFPFHVSVYRELASGVGWQGKHAFPNEPIHKAHRFSSAMSSAVRLREVKMRPCLGPWR